VGGFSENFRVGEDPELALKLVEAGYQIRFCPGLSVIHDHDIDTFQKVLKKHLGWGRSLGLKMERKHGGRTGSWHFLLENPLTHLLLLPALALASTVKIALYNRHERRMWQFFCFILAAKLSFRWGVFQRTGTCHGQQ
jgi:GT2 family glycosyltransferase